MSEFFAAAERYIQSKDFESLSMVYIGARLCIAMDHWDVMYQGLYERLCHLAPPVEERSVPESSSQSPRSTTWRLHQRLLLCFRFFLRARPERIPPEVWRTMIFTKLSPRDLTLLASVHPIWHKLTVPVRCSLIAFPLTEAGSTVRECK